MIGVSQPFFVNRVLAIGVNSMSEHARHCLGELAISVGGRDCVPGPAEPCRKHRATFVPARWLHLAGKVSFGRDGTHVHVGHHGLRYLQ